MKFTAFPAFHESAHLCLVRGLLKEIAGLFTRFQLVSLHCNCPMALKSFSGKCAVRELNAQSQQPARVK